ncbi:hypothetical protein DFQ01_11382 [Paenibacillus cellulosilyticus]|uniref:Uncharacterized protein n=1 Tax=Paenibacillus cellulosilyticus TaxID=375489 RepID=A0A2V2YRT9_9BACL|nr:hypothetical protein [Paenibacillus cellulosilyticus]PWV99708.1 hypothetical protein DFQ01_11382 [Paenibacillus cellulosilyticus]QKS44858.1 hypothetical protein HUB94_10885 [Paenibacillus cellulosilyticus]
MAVTNEKPAPADRRTAPPPVQSEAEQSMVKRYVLLGIVMRILDHDIRVVARSGMKLPRLYESMLRAVQDRVLLDLAALRKQFRDAGIKIYEESQQHDSMVAKYVCRGYHHQFAMVWGFVKAESERLMKTYLRD